MDILARKLNPVPLENELNTIFPTQDPFQQETAIVFNWFHIILENPEITLNGKLYRIETLPHWGGAEKNVNYYTESIIEGKDEWGVQRSFCNSLDVILERITRDPSYNGDLF